MQRSPETGAHLEDRMGAGGGFIGASRFRGPVLVAPLQQRHHLEGGGCSEVSEPCGGDAL